MPERDVEIEQYDMAFKLVCYLAFGGWKAQVLQYRGRIEKEDNPTYRNVLEFVKLID
jgi:hypothetical protein